MGLFRDDQGKTEQPTPQKLSDARDKGQTPISKEFTMAGTLLVAVFALEGIGPWLLGSFREVLREGMSLELDHVKHGEIGEVTAGLSHVVWTVMPPFAALTGMFVLATLLFGYGQIGVKVSKKALKPKFAQLNPVKGFGKIFKFNQIVKMFMSVLKLIVLGSVLTFVLRDSWGVFATMHDHEFVTSVAAIAMLGLRVFFWVALVVLLLAVGDIIWQRYDFIQNLKMTKQEVDDERKRTDGDPMVKSRMRQARMEFMRQRMMEAIADADVVITNPTHYSVALRYDRVKDAAPRLVAKGLDDVALRIRELAAEHDVPLMEDPPLARALYRAVKVDTEIPEKFYRAVAAVLGHVYRLKDRVA